MGTVKVKEGEWAQLKGGQAKAMLCDVTVELLTVECSGRHIAAQQP